MGTSGSQDRAIRHTQSEGDVVLRASSATTADSIRDTRQTVFHIKAIEEEPKSPFSTPCTSPTKRNAVRLAPTNQPNIRQPNVQWVVDRENVIVPGYDEHEDDDSLFNREEESIWKELFPEEGKDGAMVMEQQSADLSQKSIKQLVRDMAVAILRSKRFWRWIVIAIVQVTAIALGVSCLVYQPPGLTWEFQAWRVCFLIATLPFTWMFGDLFCWLTIKFVETCMFTVPNALYFAYAIKGPLRWVMRSLALTILWALMMTVATGAQNSTVNTVYDYVLKVLGCITLFFTANLLKRLAAKSLALNLNKGKQQYKLEAALTKEKILRALLRPTMITKITSKDAQSFSKYSDLEQGDVHDDDAEQEKPKGRQVASNRKEVILRLNLLETYIRNHTIAVSFKDELNQTNIAKVENEMEAKRVGSFLYWNIKGSLDSDGIAKEDLLGYVHGQDVDLAFAMLDIDGDGLVSLKDCIEAVRSIYLERRNLANHMRDSRNITKTLENLIGIVVHVTFIFFYLLVFEANVRDVWVSFSGFIIGFSFIFSRTVAEIFDNVVFLFGTHPYGIGDLIHVNDEQMTVEEITLNFTCMTTSCNRTVWMPNQYLIKNPFTNLSTSGNFFESIVVYVDMDVVLTRPDILDVLLSELESVRASHSSEFGATLRCAFEFSQTPLKIGIKVVYEYSHSATNFKRTAEARTLIYAAMARILTENGIAYTWPAEKGVKSTMKDG